MKLIILDEDYSFPVECSGIRWEGSPKNLEVSLGSMFQTEYDALKQSLEANPFGVAHFECVGVKNRLCDFRYLISALRHTGDSIKVANNVIYEGVEIRLVARAEEVKPPEGQS